MLCEKYLGFYTNNLCSGDLLVVCDRVTCRLCEKYLGFFINGLCSRDLSMVRD